MSRQLVVCIQQGHRVSRHHHEYVQITGVVGQEHGSLLCCTEIIFSRGKSMPHDTVPGSRPIIRCRRGYSSVGPAVLVDNVDAAALVGETAVLHASAVEVLVGSFRKGQNSTVLAAAGLEKYRSTLTQYFPARTQVRDSHCPVLLTERKQDYVRGQIPRGRRLLYGIDHFPAGILYQDIGRWVGLGRADYTAVVVPEETENIGGVEIHRHAVSFVEDQLGCRRIEAHCLLYGLSTGTLRAEAGRSSCGEKQDRCHSHSLIHF